MNVITLKKKYAIWKISSLNPNHVCYDKVSQGNHKVSELNMLNKLWEKTITLLLHFHQIQTYWKKFYAFIVHHVSEFEIRGFPVEILM